MGGVQAVPSTSHQWVTYIDTSGVPHLAQPAFGDLSGVAAVGQIPTGTSGATVPRWDLGGTFTGAVTQSANTNTFGSNTGAPVVHINGAAGGARGIYWDAAGVNRWRFVTNASDDLSLFSYDPAGAFVDTALLVQESDKTLHSNFRIVTSNTVAAPPGATDIGPMFTAHNTGSNAAVGAAFQYFSVNGTNGFDTGIQSVSVFDPVFVAGQHPADEGMFFAVVCPNDQANNFGCNMGEWDIVNRGPDAGWHRDRTNAWPTGGLLIVPEVITFSQPGEGKNVTYGYSASRSGGTNSTGFPAKFYNDFLCEPNSEVGLTGRCMYATGDITGTASQYPYSPFQTDGTWLHGFSTSRATYTDGYAYRLGLGQGIAWDVGGIDAPTATASINTTGSGANESITLNPAGTGNVQVNGPFAATGTLTVSGDTALSDGRVTVGTSAGTQSQIFMEGPASVTRQFVYRTAGVTRWAATVSGAEGGSNAGGDWALNNYTDAGAFISQPIKVTRSTGLVNLSGALQFSLKTVATLPTCNGAAAGTVAMVSDALSPAYNVALTGGGTGTSAIVLAECNGAAWTAH
jgi:hypothetical protein